MSITIHSLDELLLYCKSNYICFSDLPSVDCTDLARYIYSFNDPFFCVYQSNGDFLESVGIHISYSQDGFVVSNVGKNWDNVISTGDRLVAIDDQSVEKGLIGKSSRAIKVNILSGREQLYQEIMVSDPEAAMEHICTNRLLRINDTLYVDLYGFSLSTLYQIDDKMDGIERIIIDLRGFLGGDIKSLATYLTYFSYKDMPARLIFENSRQERVEHLYYNQNRHKRVAQRVDFIINRQTVSSSELFCSSMREIYPGTVYGENSYGKNVIQKRIIYDTNILLIPVYKFIHPLNIFGGETAKYSKTSIIPDKYGLIDDDMFLDK